MSNTANVNSKPVGVDLFSGAGGLSLGFSQAGFDIAAWVEKDLHASQTLRVNHAQTGEPQKTVINKPIESVTYGEIEAAIYRAGAKQADILIGGPPCKGFSRSNMRTRTIENPMNFLYIDFLNFAGRLKPKIVVMENVGEIRSFAGGRVMEDIQWKLECMGYRVNIESLDASRYGVPQKRRRTIVVAHRKHLRFQYPEGDGKPPPTVWDAISDLPKVHNGNARSVQKYRAVAKTPFQKLMRGTRRTVSNNLLTKNGDLVLRRYSHIPQGGNWRDIPGGLMENYADKERCHSGMYRRLHEDSPSVTITNFRKNMLIHPTEDRGLSVREVARLQSFPDAYTFKGSLSSQQQQVADAVPPLMAKAVAVEVLRSLSTY